MSLMKIGVYENSTLHQRDNKETR